MSSESPDDETIIFTILQPPNDATFLQRLAWDITYRGVALGLPRDHPGLQILEGASSSVAGPRTTHQEESPPDSGSDDAESDADTVQSPASVASTLVDLVDLEDAQTGTKEKAVILAARRGATGSRRGLFTLPTNESLRTSRTAEPDLITRRSNVYYMTLTLSQDVPPDLQLEENTGAQSQTHHKLLVDTGTSTPWILGLGYQEIDKNSWSISDWPASTFGTTPEHEVVIEHDCELVNGEWKMKKDALSAQLSYGNAAKAAVTLMKEAHPFIIVNTFTWPRVEKNTLTVNFTPGVAYAVSDFFDYIETDGILGLEPNVYQQTYKNANGKRVSPESFSYVLSQIPTRQRPDNGEEGIIYYLGMRRKPSLAFLAYDRWPCVKPLNTFQPSVPPWSAEIPVVDGSERWKVRLMVLHFEYRDVLEGGTRAWRRNESLAYRFGEHGIEVLLDTGTSLSWLPDGLAKHVRLKVLPSPQNTAIHERQGSASQMSGRFQGEAPYVATLVPDDWRVTLGFQGWNGNIVEVPLPIDPFLLMPIPGVSTPEPAFYYEGTCCVSPSTQYILGLNFFESAFVSLHNPRPGFVGTHTYVKMAPQWPNDVADYQLPGVQHRFD